MVIEQTCPLCRAEAHHWAPDYVNECFAAMYDCECHLDESRRSAFIRGMEARQSLFRSRCRFMRRLPRDYRAMLGREYETTEANAAVVAAALTLGARDRLYLHGLAGRGKTHLQVLAAQALLGNGVSVNYLSELELFEMERAAARGLSHASTRDFQVLVLEDLGKSPASDFTARVLYEALEYRTSQGLGWIITSNHSPEEAALRAVRVGKAGRGAGPGVPARGSQGMTRPPHGVGSQEALKVAVVHSLPPLTSAQLCHNGVVA